MRVIETPHAMVEPDVKTPFTADMCAIVDAFRNAGLMPRIPGAYRTRDTIYVHPAVMANIQRKVSDRFNDNLRRIMF